MPLNWRWTALAAAALAGTGSAAGVLGTTAAFATTRFCQTYGCDLIEQAGKGWLYRLDTGDAVLVTRASQSPGSPMVGVGLVIYHPQARNFEVDRATFSALQREMLGGVAVSEALGRCYDLLNDTATLYAFGGGANFRQVSCGRFQDAPGSGLSDAMMLVITSLSAAGNTSAPAGPASSGAPRFTEWHFTGCSAGGRSSSVLTAGTASLCTLSVTTVPNGARPISAEFRYELEYSSGGKKQKITLDGVDRWSSGGGGTVQFAASGSQLRFTLPLNVRLRPDRRYSSINAIGTINFDNGSSKRIYEPLSIAQP